MKEIFYIVIIAFILCVIGLMVYQNSFLVCTRSHVEVHYQQPLSVVSGQVAIPLGNATPVQVTVCDEYKRR